MATILTKKSDTASAVPLAADLTNAAGGAELAVNATDKRLFSKTSGGTVVELGTNPSTLVLPSGSANGVAYLNGSKVVTSGSALTFDGTNLGVGTTSPAAKLGVAGNIFISGASSYIAFDATQSGSTPAFIQYASNSLVFGAGSSEQMRLTSTGLGIGTSSPAEKLHVNSGTGNVPALFESTDPIAVVQFKDNNSTLFNAVGVQTNSLIFYSGDNINMRLDSSGNLGLGVTPSAWRSGGGVLEINASTNGYIAINNAGGGILQNAYRDASNFVYKNTGTASYFNIAADGVFAWNRAASGTAGNAITFTQALTLTSAGELLIATTTTTGNGAAFLPAGSGSGMLLRIARASEGTAHQFAVNSNVVGSIYTTASATTYNTSSDYRLKNITGPVTTSGSYIDNLNPVEGTWKADGSTFVGLIAHEVQEASRTQVATGTKDGAEMQAMDYSNPELIANLIAEVKSLRQRVATLEAK